MNPAPAKNQNAPRAGGALSRFALQNGRQEPSIQTVAQLVVVHTLLYPSSPFNEKLSASHGAEGRVQFQHGTLLGDPLDIDSLKVVWRCMVFEKLLVEARRIHSKSLDQSFHAIQASLSQRSGLDAGLCPIT